MEVLSYSDVVGEILSHTAKRRDDLTTMHKLLADCGNPHLGFPTIHIAGTNGKGQVAAKIFKALVAQGYRVGLFTSPHLHCYTERININGVAIEKEVLVEYWMDLKERYRRLGCCPNFFDCTTFFGFRYFARKNVDIGIIEVGLGGRNDSTNVIRSLVSVITSIGYDHRDYLGPSIEDIAWQKAGVIKPSTPVVVGPKARFCSIASEAKKQGAVAVQVECEADDYDVENRAVASAVLHQISRYFPTDQSARKQGLNFSLECRFEKRGQIIYDVAHNPDAFSRLIEVLKHRYPHKTFRFVIGMGKDKDIAASLKYVSEISAYVHFVKAHPQRGAEPEELAKEFARICLRPYAIERSIKKAVERAKSALNAEQLLVICGSFYLMHEAKQ